MTMRLRLGLCVFQTVLTLIFAMCRGAGAAPGPDDQGDDLVRVQASIRYYITGEYSPEVPIPKVIISPQGPNPPLERIRDRMITEVYPGQADTPKVWGEVCQFYEYLLANGDLEPVLARRCIGHLDHIVGRAQQSAAAASVDVTHRLQRAVRDWFIRRDDRMDSRKGTYRNSVQLVGLRLWGEAASDVRLRVEKRRRILLFLLKNLGDLGMERDTRRVLPPCPSSYVSLALWPESRFLLEAIRAEADADPAFALAVARAMPEADATRIQGEPYLGFFLFSGQTGPAREFLGRLLQLIGLAEAERSAIAKLEHNLKKIPVVAGWHAPDLPKYELVDGDDAVRQWIIPRLEEHKDTLMGRASVLGQRLLEDCLRELKAPAPKEPLIDIYMRYLYKAWGAGYAWPPVPQAFDPQWPHKQDPSG